MRREAGPGSDLVVVPDAQRAPMHAILVAVIGEAEVEVGLEPTVVRLAELLEGSQFDHGVLPLARKMATDPRRSSFGLVTAFLQRSFEALGQSLPQGRGASPYEEEESADDGQVGLHRCGQRRGGDAGKPRVLGLHGRIERAWRLWIDAFRDELAQDDVAVRKIERGAHTP